MKSLRLFSNYDVLYGKIKSFVRDHLFGRVVELENANTLKNLSEPVTTKTIIDIFLNVISELTLENKKYFDLKGTINIAKTPAFIVKNQKYVVPNRCIFNYIVGDSTFELRFALFLDECEDVISFTKNYPQIDFNLDYVKEIGGNCKILSRLYSQNFQFKKLLSLKPRG